MKGMNVSGAGTHNVYALMRGPGIRKLLFGSPDRFLTACEKGNNARC